MGVAMQSRIGTWFVSIVLRNPVKICKGSYNKILRKFQQLETIFHYFSMINKSMSEKGPTEKFLTFLLIWKGKSAAWYIVIAPQKVFNLQFIFFNWFSNNFSTATSSDGISLCAKTPEIDIF